jgi:hypothetical protein
MFREKQGPGPSKQKNGNDQMSGRVLVSSPERHRSCP